MRMCPNVPAQHAIPAALDGGIDITPLLLPGGRLRDQRDPAWELLTAIPGVDCYQPAGALYLFPRLDPEVHKIVDDQRMCIDLLEQQHVLLTHGTGFNLPSTRPHPGRVPGAGRDADRRDRAAGRVPWLVPAVSLSCGD